MVRNKLGKTPLMLACQVGDKEVFNSLLDAGVDIHAATPLGDTALTIAQKNGQQELALELVQRGASLRGKRPTTPKTSVKPEINI